MAFAEVQLRIVLSKLVALTSDEYKLSKKARKDIMVQKHEVEAMKDSFQKLPRGRAPLLYKSREIWLADFTELLYDIDDGIDASIVRRLTKAKGNHSIATDMKDIMMRICEINDRRQRYFPEYAAEPDITMDPRVLALYTHASTLVGINAHVEKMSNLLTEGNSVRKQKLLVLSIVGVGGLGKTTIAGVVYQRLQGEFDCRAFVSLSSNRNMKNVLMGMLLQLTPTEAWVLEDHPPTELIIRKIRRFLINKRYLICIDDVWDEGSWKIISSVLIDSYLGSRVIVTTRNINLANLSSSDGTIYELDPLSSEDSKRLLYKRIFNVEDGISSELEEVTEKILNRCGGIPLAIITIASMLASKPSRTKYEWYHVYNSMVSGWGEDEIMNDMGLSLSYGDWPSYLKPCLLYLSMFPQDYEIQKDRLIRMWVAEGFVEEMYGKSLYEAGESYFTELVNRSMIHPIDINENGTARAYRVHSVIFDLIISLSARENIVAVTEDQILVSPVGKIRRLSLQGSKVHSDEDDSTEERVMRVTVNSDCLRSLVNSDYVRSLTVFGDASHWIPPLSRFPKVRVLALESISNKNNHPKDLVRLNHLRYLALGGKPDKKLLEQIGNLQLLKILDLWDASIQELPTGIFQLRKLEHLIINVEVKLPEGLGNLISLQELAVLNADKSPYTLAELGNLTELRQLTMQGLDDNEGCMITFLQSLSKLSNIRSLSFLGNGLCSLDNMLDQWKGPSHLRSFIGGNLTISRLPQWFSTLVALSFLSIEVKMLTQDDLLLLGDLPKLHFLELKLTSDGITDKQLIISIDQPFPSLEEFKFRHCLRCRLVFAPRVMPNLQRLVLYFNVTKREGGYFDIGLENLTSLKHVTVKVDCDGARVSEVEDVEIKLNDAVDVHPNHPTLELSRHSTETMEKDEISPEMSSDIFEKKLENIMQSRSLTPISLSLGFLEAITDGFSKEREIGKGRYGVVYKGVLRSGNVIAVKKLVDIHLVEDTFQNEITNLVGKQHQNIVQLVGYCVESRSELMPLSKGKHVMADIQRIFLCFEYISNRSLDYHVSDEFSGFEWGTRYEIIKGICSGLHFLHETCHIVHLDLKPENILMDDNMIPKIADFGLSRLLGEQKTRTIIKGSYGGTPGYMAPEYLMQGIVSAKADIYSFGVIIIQIITGRRDQPLSTVLYSDHDIDDNTLQSIETSVQHFTENVLQRWKSRIETSTRSSPNICLQQVRKCITLALKCVNHDSKKRPTTGEILQMLNAPESSNCYVD